MRTARPTSQRLAAGFAALALGFSLTACGGSDDPESADDPGTSTSTSSDATSEPSDSAASDPAPIDDGGQVAPEAFVARIQNGVENTDYAHIEFTMTGASGSMEGSGDTDYTVTPANMKMTMTLNGQELNLLLVDKVMYVESPQAPGKFIKYDLDDPSNPFGSQLTDSLDPATSMAKFAEAVSSVTSLGEEDVDGQTLHHYEMSIDTSKLAADTPSAPPMPAELTAGVWLDNQDRMAKSTFDLGEATYQTTLSDFDTPVEITAPPEDQVITPPAA